ncbi:MAG: LTA synthase family protein [Candidatus Shapirobacteria bacterium]|nr:LTA synthase family protein [Candidatus Shapirobacteria bacterium]
MLGAPFTINDIHLIGELSHLIPNILRGTSLKKELILGIIGIIILFYFLKKKFNQNNPPIKNKIILLIIPTLIFSFPILFPTQYQQGTNKIKIENYIPNPIDSCYVNGNLFCFYNDLRNLRTPPPPDYNQKKIDQIYSQLTTEDSQEKKEEKPNIIVILSEAFWDPTLLPHVTYVPDPIPNIRQDIKSTFISPSFGGGTANVEFELLTGLSNYFLSGISPYSQSIRKPMPSLFTLFKDQGYLTTTIHPFRASFYNRKSVYKNFGLDNFISSGNMKDAQYAGPFISDAYFDQQIVNQLNSSDQPQLIFGISMQNHVVFTPNRYSDHPIKIKSNLSQNDQDILQSYVDGLHLTDLDYIQLKENLEKINKPTILILFGDHLTSLGDGRDIYQRAGLDIGDQNKMHSTLVATWSNFNQKFDLPPQISPNFLSLEILKLAGIQPKYQFSFLNSLKNTDHVLNKDIPTKMNSEQLNNYKLVQYDLIYGKQYGLK